MIFKDLYLNFWRTSTKDTVITLKQLITDKRLKRSFILLLIMFVLSLITEIIYKSKKLKLTNITENIKGNTLKLNQNLNIRKKESTIPLFETSMQNMGAYLSLIDIETCLSKISACFLQKIKPKITISYRQQNHKDMYSHQTLNISFQSSFDFEILDMMEYVLKNAQIFGLTRLKEFEIEQMFEAEPKVKGSFVYEQLSLKP